jgi:hypothetical protein
VSTRVSTKGLHRRQGVARKYGSRAPKQSPSTPSARPNRHEGAHPIAPHLIACMLSHAKCSPALRRRDDLNSDVDADCRAPTRCDETRHFGFRRSRTGAPEIGISGAKYWLFRFKLKGRSSRISVAAFTSVSLAQARAAALENRFSWSAASIRGRLSAPIASIRSSSRAVSPGLFPAFKKIGINTVRPHDLRRTGRTELGRLGVSKHIAERVLNHSKDVIEGTYDPYE